MKTSTSKPKAVAKPVALKEVNILTEVNKYRTENKLKPLAGSKSLDSVALQRAKYIYDNDDFSHKPKNGKTYKDLIDNTQYAYVGENLARKFKAKEKMIQAWKDSPTHNKLLLDDFDETGIATYNNVTVQIFGRKYR